MTAAAPACAHGRLAVVGGGWAGLAAAICATQRGHHVTLLEMAPQLGGRARAVADAGGTLDNGQHILIGAYTETLRLMEAVGVNVEAAFLRTPLRLVAADGTGLCLGPGAPSLAFVRAIASMRHWTWHERLALLGAAARWRLGGFRCDEQLSVSELTRRLPVKVRRDLIEPLCVAALNTPADAASGGVFLRVLGDALAGGAGSADLLLPRVDLGKLLPAPAARWLGTAGATMKFSHRAERLEPEPDGDGWRVDGERFDRVVLAASPGEAARLAAAVAPAWSQRVAALRFEPIVTIYMQSDGARLPEPMLALAANEADAPAQFVFDLGRLRGRPGLLAFVISGAARWVEHGSASTCDAVRRQAESALAPFLGAPFARVRVITEKRATFRCTPKLQRAPMRIAPGLHAAGDHVDGPYPATLEGAVRSGVAAVRSFG